ncbi:MAG: hypothetical protein LDL38_03220 [Flavobacterium piscis]|nr:hypothetical protein [Flavobacterium piscis]
MIEKGKRRQGTPFLISENLTQKLERIPLTEKLFQEDWLQKLIFENPQILPIDNLEIGFSPLIPLGREISTKVGIIDNLFISADGYLTIVETKLWRNPEAKREVVGQIIDYAKELTNWTFEQLNKEVRSKNPNNYGILDSINSFEPIEEDSEVTLIDNIERNLKRGRFLLLIVGDGIREGVEDMANYLQNFAQLQFTLGLVELQVYKNTKDDEGVIVIPNLITRTNEITRAIIRVENNNSSQISVTTDFDNSTKSNNNRRSTLTQDEFFEKLLNNTDSQTVQIAKKILDRFEQEGFLVEWKQATYIIKISDPNGSGSRITIFLVSKNGDCHIGYSAQQLESLGLDKKLSYEFCLDTISLFQNLGVNKKFPESWDRWIGLKEFEPKLDEFIEKCNYFVERIKDESKAVANIV